MTKRIAIKSHDEIGELAKWFNIFIEKLQGVVGTISKRTGRGKRECQPDIGGRLDHHRGDHPGQPGIRGCFGEQFPGGHQQRRPAETRAGTAEGGGKLQNLTGFPLRVPVDSGMTNSCRRFFYLSPRMTRLSVTTRSRISSCSRRGALSIICRSKARPMRVAVGTCSRNRS